MSMWGRAWARIQEWVGRAEEVYGESHGDAAAEVRGEARRLEGEADEEQEIREEAREQLKRDDDGLADAR